MMISAAPPEARKDTTSTLKKPCSLKREQVAFPIEVPRMMGLDTAAVLLGKGMLADELCITVRNLNYKINGERGACDADIVAAARGLEERGERFLSHALKLRQAITRDAGWQWWSGSSDEWYEYGPFETREQAISELVGSEGFVAECLPAGDVSFSAQELIENQFLEDNDAFDFERSEPDRVGSSKAIDAADAELQGLLDAWCARHAKTFARGNLFAGTRNVERVEATPAEVHG